MEITGDWRKPAEMQKCNVDVDDADNILKSTWPKRNTNKVNEKALNEETHILIGFCNLY